MGLPGYLKIATGKMMRNPETMGFGPVLYVQTIRKCGIYNIRCQARNGVPSGKLT